MRWEMPELWASGLCFKTGERKNSSWGAFAFLTELMRTRSGESSSPFLLLIWRSLGYSLALKVELALIDARGWFLVRFTGLTSISVRERSASKNFSSCG